MLEQKCYFNTQRLSVGSWTNQTKANDSDKRFIDKVIEILTPNVVKALPAGWQDINTKDKAAQWIQDRASESHFLSIQSLQSDETIGFMFLYGFDSDSNMQDLRFGYLLSEKVWGRGLATEVIQGLIKWCKESENIRSISGGVERDNLGSIKVLEKSGFNISSLDAPTEQIVFYEYRFDN